MVKTTDFSWAPTPQIQFGGGSFQKTGKTCAKYGKKVLVLTGKNSFVKGPYWQQLQDQVKEEYLEYHHAVVAHEPSPSLVDDLVDSFKSTKVDVVLAIGGGSVIDAGKAVSAMFMHQGSVKKYLEGVGTKKPSDKKLPFIAVPTTAGTGSEATKNAVLSEVGPNGFKKSLRHDAFVPNEAIVDPELMLGCPPELTASSGMDAFTQLLESYISTKRSGMSDALAWEGLQHLSLGLSKAVENGHDLAARTHMAYAAMLSGIALANAGLGVVHGFASSVGGKIEIPHGVLCGTLMGSANRITLKKLLDEDPHSEWVQKYAAVGKLYSAEENRYGIYYAHFLIDLIEEYILDFKLPRLSQFGLKKEDIPDITAQTGQKNHPVHLSEAEMNQILTHRL